MKILTYLSKEKINSIVPIFFANEQNVASANKRLDSFGFQINDDYVSGMRNQYQMFGHPSCGPSTGYPSGHPSCGPSTGYPSGHPSCGVGSGYGNGHPSCCSSKNERGKSLLLIRKNSSGIRNEIRN